LKSISDKVSAIFCDADTFKFKNEEKIYIVGERVNTITLFKKMAIFQKTIFFTFLNLVINSEIGNDRNTKQ
jgi:hypothetical protein